MAVKKPFGQPRIPPTEPIAEAEKVNSDVTNELIGVHRCACGEPVAKGQTYVCVKHQRSA